MSKSSIKVNVPIKRSTKYEIVDWSSVQDLNAEERSDRQVSERQRVLPVSGKEFRPCKKANLMNGNPCTGRINAKQSF